MRFFLCLCAALAGAATAQEPQPATNSGGDIPKEIVRKVDPSVVAIYHERSTGSGFVISEDGYIMSNGHVVMGDNEDDPTEPAKAITVVLNDESKYSARVLGFSLNPDVALLKIEARKPLVPVDIADLSEVQIGQPCFAVGTPHGLKRTFSRGILSNVDRADLGTFTKVFQTDAAINPGNSGGPLFDREGRVLGLNTYASRGANNLGFTVPIDVAMVMKDDFLEHGRFIRADVPTYFISELYDELQQALGIEDGLLVQHVMPGSAAAEAGLQNGDVLIALNGEPVSAHTHAEMLEVNWNIITREPGDELRFTVLRGAPGETETVEISAMLEENEPMMSTRRFAGEIPALRIDALGLAFKEITALHRVYYRMSDVPGVLVQGPDPSSSTERSGLQFGDIITAVEGETVDSPASFEAALLRRLREGNKAIDLSVQRGRVNFPTALRPWYDLRNQRVLVMLPPGQADRLERIVRELISDGAEVTLATLGETSSELPAGLEPPALLQDVVLEDYDRLLFVGGEGAESWSTSEETVALVEAALEADLIVAAEGAASLVIAAADHESLEDLKLTTHREWSGTLADFSGNYTGQEVENDGNVLTSAGDSVQTTRAFLKKFRGMRGQKSED